MGSIRVQHSNKPMGRFYRYKTNAEERERVQALGMEQPIEWAFVRTDTL